MLKGALHTHTTCSDGDLSPEEVLRVYRDLGFDFVALTDHDFIMKPDAYEHAEVPNEFEGMLVYRGIELTVFERGYVHISRIDGDEEVLHIFNHPAAYGLSVEQVIDRLKEVEKELPIDAVEVTMNGFYTPEFDINEIPLPKVATDDSHTIVSCGRAWIEVDCNKDRDTIIRAIKSGQARICYNQTASISHRADIWR